MGGIPGIAGDVVIAVMLASGDVPGQPAIAPPAAAIAAPVPGSPATIAVQTSDVTASPAPISIADAPPARRVRTKGDPLEGFNRSMYRLNQKFDRAIFRPIAFGYKTVVPKPVRSGLRNFFSNLSEPIVFLNDLLQLKPKRAIKTFARFFINSTAGIGGLLDLAKGDGLPHRDNGFGNTLARYGVGPGPYLFLPFFGPSTLRDLAAGQVDGLVLPIAIGEPFDRFEYQVPRGVLTGLDLRVESDAQLKALLDGAADPYATLRSVYLQNRAAEVAEVRGQADAPLLDDPLADPLPEDPAAAPADPGAAPADATPQPTPAPPAANPQTGELEFVAYFD